MRLHQILVQPVKLVHHDKVDATCVVVPRVEPLWRDAAVAPAVVLQPAL
jgi:hypothetical protein